MKTMFGKYLALIAALLLISGCPNPFEPPVPEELPVDEGYFSLYLGGINTGRTILPATVQNDFLLYTLEFFPAGTTSNPVNRTERNNSNISEPILLSSGIWDLYVIAYMDVAKTKPAAQGHLKDIEIGSGETVRNSVTLTAIIDEGKGTFNWNIDYPSAVTVASMTITPIDSASGTPKSTQYFIGGTPRVGKVASLALNAGYYRVVFNLGINEFKIERRETLHIYKNMESNFAYTFTENQFTYTIVTSGADSGVGSLRQAIADAPANSTIIIDNSVKTILLQSGLTIDKSLVIVGNSVTITPLTITPSDNSFQLLFISGSTTTVTISQVHFKDRSDFFGEAIYNYNANLTFESCIFSVKRGLLSYDWSGPLNNMGTMNIRGCTFYNNNSGGSGGVIRNQNSTVVLEGNLFYGNTAYASYPTVWRSYPVVFNWYNSTITSVGYNVIDVPFGTEENQSGWIPGTGDTTFSSLGINGVPLNFDTFVPILGLDNYIASVSEDFPLTDFYGNNRTFPGVPGAVASVDNIAVTDIIGVPTSGKMGTPLTLTGTVYPNNAPYQDIMWIVSSDGNTGATITNGNVLNTTSSGTVILTAIVANGIAPGVAYFKNFTITVDFAFVAVSGIIGIPESITVGTPFTLSGTITPSNATNQDIVWTVINAGSTGATITGGNVLNTTGIGYLIVTATIANGTAPGTAYTRSFGITVNNTFVAVSNITGVPTSAPAGTLALNPTITPSNATNQNITWTISNAGTTGANIGNFYNTLNTTGTGTVTVTATIANGTAQGTAYTQNFTITILPHIAVSEITNVPTMVVVGYDLILTSTISPSNASYKTIAWSVSNAGNTGAQITYAGDYILLSTIRAGTAIVRATIANGTAPGTPYIQYFEITILPHIAVTDIINVPTTAYAGIPLYFINARAFPNNATQSAIQWEVTNAGTTGAAFIGSRFITTGAGTVTVRATVPDGISKGRNYTKNFTITVRPVFMVTSNADSGAGSLRYALQNASPNDIIYVDSSVGTISLSSSLSFSNRIIDGNGVTITRNPSWTTVDNYSQLLRTGGTTVTISRVHFKDGRTTQNGGAIYNQATNLTLESCIFSGNKCIGNNGFGGVIYNQDFKTLTVKGCTFYNNEASQSAGAIYNSGILILEGNLFYGNTAAGLFGLDPVVYSNILSTVTSRGNNIVDVPLGREVNQSGWYPETGDSTFSSLGINGVPFNNNFAPVSSLQNYISPIPEDYPLTDFIGNYRIYSCAPGAVH
jgi:hypothetical protein